MRKRCERVSVTAPESICLNLGVTEFADALVQSFRALCDREGGWRSLAAKIQVTPHTLYQIYAGVQLPSGRARGVGPAVRAKLDAAFPGWHAHTTEIARIDQGGLALDHRLSYQAVTVPHLTREELTVMGQQELPKAFRIELLDDALGARAPRGTSATFERREPMWGDAVLLLDAKGEPHVRVYRQSLEHEWEGYAPNPNFATFNGAMSGVRVVAVLESLGGGWAQLGR